MGHAVDLKTWNRRAHYQLFRGYRRPFFSTTVEVDVGPVWNACHKPDGPPFFLTSMFLLLKAVNDTEALRLRRRKRGVWLHDSVAVGTTILRDDETFGFVRLELSGGFDQFIKAGRLAMRKATAERRLDPLNRTDDVVFHSMLPWLNFTSLTNALPGNDSIPRLAFGKCVRKGRAVRMPVGVEVHHALVDGLDVGRFIERFAGLFRSKSHPW